MTRAHLGLIALMVTAAACGLLRSGGAPGTARGRATQGRIWEHSDHGAGPSYAIIPTQRIPLRFDHGQHMRLAGVTCARCHQQALDSTAASDRLVPPESTCAPCHAIDRHDPLRVATPAARCDACHVGFDAATPVRVARVEIPPSNLTFSHRAHAARGVACEQCHGTMRDVGLGTRLDLPTMRSCFACHAAGRTASPQCATCHLTQPDGTLVTQFAEGWLNPPTWMTGLHHDADFWFTHRVAAADGGARCETCHRESECQDCHDGRQRDRRIHSNDYVFIHAAEARADAQSCTSCHRVATFCEGCHLRVGVAQDAPAGTRSTERFHPPAEEWSGRVVGPRHHGLEARRALTTCVACHAERDCTTCHAGTGLGGAGINPHPPGWLNRCGDLLAASPRACAQCHDNLESIAARCR